MWEHHVTGSTDAYIKEMPVVVIDAGHGGTDPGKVGVDGSLEKDINLAVAKRLKTYLEQDDIRVIMTRETGIQDFIQIRIAGKKWQI